VRVTELSLSDFRCYHSLQLILPPGVTVVMGGNGHGKTSLLEALGWAATGRSFRGVPDAALVRAGCEQAVLRVSVERAGAAQLLEIEIRARGRNRVLRNRQALTRSRDLLGLLLVTLFAPDDLQLVKGGPVERRTYLDDLLVSLAPRYEAVRADFERVVRQRTALLRSGVVGREAETTLLVFDDQLVEAGEDLVRGRLRLAARLGPLVADVYHRLAGGHHEIGATYEAEWAEGAVPVGADVESLLRNALKARRREELERGVTLVGPHRDEWRLCLGPLDARSHASQGEQRTLALAMRLASHRLCTDVVGDQPVLLLDDVFSELDPDRAAALVGNLPDDAQTLVTSASTVPSAVHPERQLRVVDGRLEEAA
jgi:DNA replication and repair protein RecF